MYSKFMGLPDSTPVFFSQKDLQLIPIEKECKLFLRPTLESQDSCQIAPISDAKDKRVPNDDEDEQEQDDRSNDLEVYSLKVKLPCLRDHVTAAEAEEEDSDGCKTPTSEDHKIPMICPPPPPRKAKSVPDTNKKGTKRRVFLDMSNEIESMFPQDLRADFGKKIKKIRKLESLII